MSDEKTPAAGATQEYLTAEEAAQELVSSLRELRDATEGYVAAEKKLTELGRRLIELADATQQTGEKVVQAADAVRSVSGPEILAQARSTQESLTAARATLDEHKEAVVEAFAEQSADRAETWQKQETALAALARQVRTATYLSAAAAAFAIAATVIALVR